MRQIVIRPLLLNADGESEFFFGLATAPAHVEDKLNDAWLQFAEESPCDQPESQQGHQPADAVIASAAGDGGSQQASASGRSANRTGKKGKPLKVAMEAMIRGFRKYVEEDEEEKPDESASNEECHHNVAAWHNVPHP